MASDVIPTIINLTAVVVAVTKDTPRVLMTQQYPGHGKTRGRSHYALPNGPFKPDLDSGLEHGLRRLVEEQTGLDLYYVEQLYTFGNRYRSPEEIDGGPRVVSVAYIALTHEEEVIADNAVWANWYDFLPWEDWRKGKPSIIPEFIEPALERWIRNSKSERKQQNRQRRFNVTIGHEVAADVDSVLALERFELLYEAGLVSEASRDADALGKNLKLGKSLEAQQHMGAPVAFDHRRILATALGRLRGKLAYRPVVFDLLPGEFTLLQLQRVVEALSGAKLHKQNFRRLVTNADLVEPIGRNSATGRGRPAELFRFRREVLGERLTVGVSRPVMRDGDN